MSTAGRRAVVLRELAKGAATTSPATQLAGSRPKESVHRRRWRAHGPSRAGWAPLPPAEEPGEGGGGSWRWQRRRRRRERGRRRRRRWRSGWKRARRRQCGGGGLGLTHGAATMLACATKSHFALLRHPFSDYRAPPSPTSPIGCAMKSHFAFFSLLTPSGPLSMYPWLALPVPGAEWHALRPPS
jgi:hypothetical protein